MASDFERLKKKSPVHRWTGTIGDDPDAYHFRAMTERENSMVSMLGLSLDPKTMEVRYTGTPATIRQQKLLRVAYQWINDDGTNVIDGDEWDSLGDFDSNVIDRLFELCAQHDSEDDGAGVEAEAIKKSA